MNASRTMQAALIVAASLAVVMPVPAAAKWTFVPIPRYPKQDLPHRLIYEVTFDESTFGDNRNTKALRQIRNLFTETKEHGSLVVETSIRGEDEHAIRSCGKSFDARQNTTVVEQYKREKRSVVSRVLGEHREYVDMSLVFGERLIRGEVSGSDERALKLAVSLRTYSEDVRVAMANLTSGLEGFGNNVADKIQGAVPGLDFASLAFSAFTRTYDTSICAETYVPLQDLRDVRWIVFHDDQNGVIDPEEIEDSKTLNERLSEVGGYALFSVDVKDYNCNVTRPESLHQCQLATQLMKDWLGASQYKEYQLRDWDFEWDVSLSPATSDHLEAEGQRMSMLVDRFKLEEHIGNYKRDPATTFPTWTVLGTMRRNLNERECFEDVLGEVMFFQDSDGNLAIKKLSISGIRYDNSDYYTLRRGEQRFYPSQKRHRRAEDRCECIRNPKDLHCMAPIRGDLSPTGAGTG